MSSFQNFILFGMPIILTIGGYFYARSARNIGKHHHHPAE